MTRDRAERPVLAWGDLGVGQTFRDVGCVAFPTDSGWTPGEEIPGSDDLLFTPYVARDRNGDVWAAWRIERTTFNRWTHTYVKVTTSTPGVQGAGPHRTVTWTLSEPAPESWWAVPRARGEGAFEDVARVRASVGLEMSWIDSSAPGGVLRYKIRRESVDTRYPWESEEAHWPPQSRKPVLRLIAPGPIGPVGHLQFGLRLELEGAAAGPVEVSLYDLQGRLGLRHQPMANGTGQDSIRLDFSAAQRPLTPGIYFISLRDASGQTSEAAKVVVLP